jgi:hypothetical protein
VKAFGCDGPGDRDDWYSREFAEWLERDGILQSHLQLLHLGKPAQRLKFIPEMRVLNFLDAGTWPLLGLVESAMLTVPC